MKTISIITGVKPIAKAVTGTKNATKAKAKATSTVKKAALAICFFMAIAMMLCGCQTPPLADGDVGVIFDEELPGTGGYPDDGSEGNLDDGVGGSLYEGPDEYYDDEYGDDGYCDYVIPESGQLLTYWDGQSDLLSFEVMIDEEWYSLPAPYSEFAKDGWKIDPSYGGRSLSDRLNPDDTIYVRLMKGDERLLVSFINYGVDVKPLAECMVCGLFSNESENHETPEVIVPGGITLWAHEDDVLFRYGKPSMIETSNDELRYRYMLTWDSSVDFTFEQDTMRVEQISIRTLFIHEKSEWAGGEAPDILDSYEAPSGLGQSWDNFTANFDGAIYRLPVPISVLMENGWVMMSDGNQLIKGQGRITEFYLRKGYQVFRTTVKNYADTQQPAKYGFITELKYDVTGARIPFEIVEGLDENSSIDDFIKAFGAPFTTNEFGGGAIYYNWAGAHITGGLMVVVDKDSGTINSISLEHMPLDFRG